MKANPLLISLLMALGTLPLSATTLIWNADGTPGEPIGGTGNWNTSDLFWDNAGTMQAWDNDANDTAIFGGTAGTVTLTTGITANGLIFNTTGYTITGNTLTLAGTTPTITANENATISSTLAGSAGMTKDGSGTLAISTRATYTGDTTVNGGILNLTGGGGQDGTLRGSVTINNGGTLRFSTGDATGFGTGDQRISAININEGGTLNVNTASNQTFSNLALTLQGGTISGVSGSNFDFFNGTSSLTTLASATTSTVSMNARLRQDNTTFTVADGAAAVDLLWSGQLNQEGTGRNFIKDGAGRMNLTGAATYSGTTTINGGYLAVSNQWRNTSSITVNNASTLELGAINMFTTGHGTAMADSRLITVNGSTLLMNGSMDSRIGNITLNNGSTWTSNRGLGGFDVLLANVDSGGNSIPATVAVTGSGASTMNGSGGIHLQGIQNFNVADTTDSADTDLNVTMRLDNPGSIGGAAGGILKQGDGTMRLANTGNSFGGDIIIEEGTLVGQGVSGGSTTPLGNANGSRTITIQDTATLGFVGNNVFGGQPRVLADIPKVVVNAGGTMTINTYNVVGNIDLNGGTLTATGGSNASYQTYEFAAGSTITVGGSTASLISSTAPSNGAIHIAGNSTLTLDVADVTGNAATDLTLSAALINGSADRPGAGALLKTGLGTVTLSGGGAYTGGTTLSQGTIIATNGNALGTGGTITINDTNTGANNTTLLLGNVTMGRAITVANEGTGTVTLGANGSVANPEFSGPITLNKAVTLDGSTNTDRLTFTGGIGGTGDVTIAGTNRVVFNSVANTYSGSTIISTGSTLQLGVGSGTTTQFIPNASVVDVGTGGVIQFAKGNNNETIGGLTGTGLVRGHPAVGGTATTLTINTSGSHSFGGELSNGGAGGATLSLTKTGAGTQTLTGTDNTYTGATLVSEGTLAVTGSLGNTTVSVENGATLAGNGNIGGSVTIESGATHALAVGATPAAQVVRLIGGALDLGAAGDILTLAAAAAPAPGTYILATATGGITGEPGTVNQIGVSGTFAIDGNNLVLTVTGGADPFDQWATDNGLDGTPGKEAGFDDDPDGDGVANGLEWILGGNPLDGQSGTLVTPTATAAGGLTLNFTREPDSIGQATLKVEYNTDLGPVWQSATIGVAGSSEANGVEITIDTNADPHAVTVNIPADPNAPDGKLFARLSAEQTIIDN